MNFKAPVVPAETLKSVQAYENLKVAEAKAAERKALAKVKPAPQARIQTAKAAVKKSVKGPAKTAPKPKEKPKPKAPPRPKSGWARAKPRSVSKTRKRAGQTKKKSRR